MSITSLFESVFWNTATQMALIIMPIISITIIVKIIHYFIIKAGD